MMYKFCIFIPLYSPLTIDEEGYLHKLIKDIKLHYKNDIKLIISDNSKKLIHSSFKIYDEYVKNKGNRKNQSIFKSLDSIEQAEYLIILDPDDRINLQYLLLSYKHLKADVIQTR